MHGIHANQEATGHTHVRDADQAEHEDVHVLA
jgi:hypothetical protein